MRGGRDCRLGWIVSGLAEAAICISFKPQQPVAEDSRFRQAVPHLWGHGSQVFSHDDKSMPRTLERENSQQVLHKIANVDAFRGREPIRYPVQPEKSHDVIDA